MAAKVKALQQWCKMQCDGYRDVNITNMTSSWKSGLAFCAIIHRYRPELIDYDSLSKENVFQNNKLAFEVAQQLGIPALLDAEDMVVMTVPDKLCIITYVSQYYNFFRNYKPAAAAAATSMKRHLPEETSTATAAKKPVVEKPILEENKNQNDPSSASSKRRTLEDTCNICQGKVFLMERQIEDKKLYHRHCLRNMQKEQSSTLRSVQKMDDQLQNGLEQCREVQNESMEYDEFHSDAATGGRDCGNAIQVPVPRLDPTTCISSGKEKTIVAGVSAGTTHDLQATSVATMDSSTAVTSVRKSVVVVTSDAGAPSISSFSSSATFQPKTGTVSSPVVLSVSSSHISHTEDKTHISEKSPSKPAEARNQSTLTPVSHNLQTPVGQSTPISSNQPTQILPTASPSSLHSKESKSSESPSTQSIQVPLRPKLPPTIIPQQSGTSTNISPSTSVPPKPPRVSVIVETLPVESGKGQDNSLAETSTPAVSLSSSSSHKVASVASNTIQGPDCNVPAGGVGDARNSVQTTTTIHPSQNTSAQNNVSSSALSPKTRPAPTAPSQSVSMSTNLPVSISTSTNLPISNPANLSVSTSTNLPDSDSTNLSISNSANLPASTNLPISNSGNLSISTSTDIPVSTSASPSVPVTTLCSILKSKPAPSPPGHSLPSSTAPSPLSRKIISSTTSSTLDSHTLSTSESFPSSASTTSTTASSSSVPKPATRHHISTPAVHPVSTPPIPHASTPPIHHVLTPPISPVSTETSHPVSTPAIHLVSTQTSHAVSHPLPTPTNAFGGNSNQKQEIAVSHGSTSHVISTQSVKSPISHTGRTPPSRPVLPPSGLPGQVPGNSKLSLAVSTSTSATSGSSVLPPTLTQPSASLSGQTEVPPTTKESSEAVHVIPTKEVNEQILSKDASQNDGQFVGQVSGQSVVQSADQPYVQSGGKPPVPKWPPSILVSMETEGNKHLPVKPENALDQKLVLNSGYKDNKELKEKKNHPVGNEDLVNGATVVDLRPEARRSVRTNPFNSPEPPSPDNPEDFRGKLIKDQATPGILRKETLHKMEELPKKSTGSRDTNKDIEKVPMKPCPSPRSTGKVKADVPSPSLPQSESNSSTWYVDLEPNDLHNGTSSAVPESHGVTGAKMVPNELGQGMVEEIVNQQKPISLPVPLPRSRSKKGNDDALPVNSDAQAPRPKRLSPAPPTVQPSDSIKPSVTPTDGTAGSGVMRAPPPRPTPPRAESIQLARKKITPDTTFTFEDQSFNFGPTSGSRRNPSDGRELQHLRSSTVASSHNQPVVKRKVNAEGRLSAQYITEQLRLLDTTLKKLEKEGRVLEDRIRSGTDESMEDDDKNDLMSQWFEMINHKNDLVRHESELIYRCRQQELEDKHEEVEFELRCLMNKPDHLKTANEKKREEVLLQKLLQTVTQRNNIVESMEEDRIRYLKEDEEIALMLTTTRLK